MKKKTMTIKSRLTRFMESMIVLTVVLLTIGIGFTVLVDQNYMKTRQQLMLLNEFFQQAESINDRLYEYTLEGDEVIYRSITEDVLSARGTLKQMADLKISQEFYRDIRDMEEMFLSYTERMQKIYDHAYLCEVMTIGSKQVINGYYQAAQEVYVIMDSEFENLYSQMLDYIQQQEIRVHRQTTIYYLDALILLIATVLFEIANLGKVARRIIEPLQALTDSASLFQGSARSQFQVKVRGDMEEEVRNLLEVYNSMVQRIQQQMKLIRENADAKERLKDQELENLKISNMLKTSELKALQMQINPHFLFNTLNMISQTAYLEQADQTRELLGDTARLLRYTLDNTDKSVTLEKEIEILSYYVNIQEQRFGDRIAFEFDLDERFHKLQVPSMILQPLVENAISHGVGMKDAGAKIRICTRYSEEKHSGFLIISDNGVGMDEATLTAVRREMEENKEIGHKIGLSNVYLRLMIFFDYQCSMNVYSSPQTGTRIVIELPCELE